MGSSAASSYGRQLALLILSSMVFLGFAINLVRNPSAELGMSDWTVTRGNFHDFSGYDYVVRFRSLALSSIRCEFCFLRKETVCFSQEVVPRPRCTKALPCSLLPPTFLVFVVVLNCPYSTDVNLTGLSNVSQTFRLLAFYYTYPQYPSDTCEIFLDITDAGGLTIARCDSGYKACEIWMLFD